MFTVLTIVVVVVFSILYAHEKNKKNAGNNTNVIQVLVQETKIVKVFSMSMGSTPPVAYTIRHAYFFQKCTAYDVYILVYMVK